MYYFNGSRKKNSNYVSLVFCIELQIATISDNSNNATALLEIIRVIILHTCSNYSTWLPLFLFAYRFKVWKFNAYAKFCKMLFLTDNKRWHVNGELFLLMKRTPKVQGHRVFILTSEFCHVFVLHSFVFIKFECVTSLVIWRYLYFNVTILIYVL